MNVYLVKLLRIVLWVFLVVSVMLPIDLGFVINLILGLGDVFLWAILLVRKVGDVMI